MSGFRVRTARARSRRKTAPPGRRNAVLLHEALLNPHHALEEELEDQRPPRAPPPSPAQEPTLGLLGAALHVGMLTAVSSVRALVSERAGVAHPKKATLDGQSPQSHPKATHHRTYLAALTDTTRLTEGSACLQRAQWTLRTLLTPGVFHQGS